MDNDKTEMPAVFLAELGKTLKASEGVDTELAKIISLHILTAVPTEDCLEQALTAIKALAANRADP